MQDFQSLLTAQHVPEHSCNQGIFVPPFRKCSYQLEPARTSASPHAEVLVGLTEHTQQDVNRTAAAAAALDSVTAKQTPPVLGAVAAAAAVPLTAPGCLATAVHLADQRLVQTAGECAAE